MASRTAISLWTLALGVVCLWAAGCGSGEGETPAPPEEGQAFKRPTRLWPDVPPLPEPSADAGRSLEPTSGEPGADKETPAAEEPSGEPTTEEPATEEPAAEEPAAEEAGGGT